MSVDRYDPMLHLDASGEDEKLLDDAAKISAFRELGVTGLKRSGGYLDEEFLPQLRGRKAISVYKEMSENDPLVGALLFTIKRLLRNVEWRVDPGGKKREDSKAQKHLETCMDDMSSSWDDFITEVLSMLPYGWAWHEVVYKRRGGLWQKDSRHRSKYNDGLVGWRKMPIRAQETLLRWVFDETGDVRAMIQLAPPRYQTVPLPIERSLLFRYEHHKGNPEGLSMLRNAYRPWFMKKRLEEFEAIGIERDLAGLPMVSVPAEMLRAEKGSKQYEAVENFRKMVKTVRRNEQEGIVFPTAYDQDTNQPLYKFELLGGGGARAFNVDTTIRRYEERILQTVLADFIMVGHQSNGSYSLHTDKTGIFRTSLNSITETIADVLNRHAVPRLFAANGWKLEKLPTIVPSDVDSPDIAVLAQFMSAMSQTGVTWFPDPTLENFVRDAARLPKLDEEEQERKRQLQMRSEATIFAQTTAEYLQAQQDATMLQMDPMGQAQVQGAAEGLQQKTSMEASGQAQQMAEQQAMEQEQAQVQMDREDEDKTYERGMREREMAMSEAKDAQSTQLEAQDKEHSRKLSLRELALKEKQLAASRQDKATDTALTVRDQDSRERQTLAQVKAKQQAAKKPEAKAKPQKKAKQR